MPPSIDEASKRYESYSQNIQDALITMESHMGSLTVFSFDLPQVIGNLDKVDTKTEERNISSYIKVPEEYRKIIILERKRRTIRELIDDKMKVDSLKADLKLRRRTRRLAVDPYQPPRTGKNEQIDKNEQMEQ